MAQLQTTTPAHPRPKPTAPPISPTSDSGKSGVIAETASQVAMDRAVDPEARKLMIAEAAYYCAEKRGFASGHDLEDWLEAESQIDRMLSK